MVPEAFVSVEVFSPIAGEAQVLLLDGASVLIFVVVVVGVVVRNKKTIIFGVAFSQQTHDT